MFTEIITLPLYELVGLTNQTTNQHEANPSTAIIGKTINQYFSIIQNPQAPRYFSAYYNYASDYRGAYSYFYGAEQATTLPEHINQCTSLTIPQQQYMHFITNQGNMPDIVIEVWQHIWQLESVNKLPAKRAYTFDFEIYGQHTDGRVDIYLSI